MSQNPVPKPYSHCIQKKKKSQSTEPEPNTYLYRKEDDEVGGSVGEERLEFEAWIVRESDGESRE